MRIEATSPTSTAVKTRHPDASSMFLTERATFSSLSTRRTTVGRTILAVASTSEKASSIESSFSASPYPMMLPPIPLLLRIRRLGRHEPDIAPDRIANRRRELDELEAHGLHRGSLAADPAHVGSAGHDPAVG